jgi:hypothetical protein
MFFFSSNIQVEQTGECLTHLFQCLTTGYREDVVLDEFRYRHFRIFIQIHIMIGEIGGKSNF